MKKHLFFLLVVFLLSACKNIPHITAEKPSQPIPPNPTPVLLSTSTETPSFAFTTIPTTNPAQATQEFLINDYSNICDRPINQSIGTSPDEQWITLHCYTQNGETVNIIKEDKSIKWEFSYFELSKQNVFDGYVRISHWTQDGNYVYISILPQFDGVGYAFVESSALYRLDLNSGQLSETLSPQASRWNFYSFGFSPNDRRLAYFNLEEQPLSLVIYDLQTGSIEVIVIGNRYNTGGNLIWADDNKLLVFSAANYDLDSNSYSTSVLLWNNEQKALSTLIDNPDMAFQPITWNGESKIILQSIFTLQSSNYEFDLETNTLSPVNP